jgi:cytoskeletal protein RodZ
MAIRARTALVFVAVATVVVVRYWPGERTRELTGHSVPGPTSQRDSSTKSSDKPVEGPAQEAPVEAAMPSRLTAASGTVPNPTGTAVQVNVLTPSRVHSGDSFQVTVDVQATRSIRQIAFSFNYSPTILQLVGSSPGVFAEKSGAAASFHLEESSDGTVLVSVDLDRGAVLGTGSVAVFEFRARNPGESPLLIHDTSYVESGHQESGSTPADYEGTITVD